MSDTDPIVTALNFALSRLRALRQDTRSRLDFEAEVMSIEARVCMAIDGVKIRAELPHKELKPAPAHQGQDLRPKVWLTAWTAVVTAPNDMNPLVASNWADECVKDFERRFPFALHSKDL